MSVEVAPLHVRRTVFIPPTLGFAALSVMGPPACAQYLPPALQQVSARAPPQTIISLPVHTAVWPPRAEGALVVSVAVQLSVPGLYLPPVLSLEAPPPPQTIISLPVHTAV